MRRGETYLQIQERVLVMVRRKDATVLDIGCGRGYFLRLCQEHGIKAVGIDLDPARVKEASQWGTTRVGDAERLAFADSSFDLVQLQNVLHHVHDHAAAMSEAARVLRPGGLCLVTETVDDDFTIRLGRKLVGSWDEHEVHARFGSRDMLEGFERAGLTVEERGGQRGFPLSAAWFLVWYPIHKFGKVQVVPKWLRRRYVPGAVKGCTQAYMLLRKKQ